MMRITEHERSMIQFMRENPDWVIGLNNHSKPAFVRLEEIHRLRQLGLTMKSVASLLGISARQCYRILQRSL